MNSYKKLNNIFGWLTFLVAMVVYTLTVEPSVSLWDCGEFISASHKLQVVHPPGAPFFLLVGRLFSMLASESVNVAWAVNMLSVTTSALTVLFTFWVTTYFAKRLISKDEEPSGVNALMILGAGLVAGLTLTFSDTFWFSAVEAEVYAMSSFFTALTFWIMVKWEINADKPGADKYIVFAFFLVGLAIGTHLLNLLVIPAMAYIFYFKRFKERTRKGMIYTFLAGLGILFFIQKGIIPGIVWLIAYVDKIFVNGFSMPFWTGSIFVILALIALIVFGIRKTINEKRYYWNLALVCLTFVLIGYSSYTMVVVRSSADPAIDMNDPEDPFNLLSYINREQYGDRPLAYGPYFNAQPIKNKEVKTIYAKGKDDDGNDMYIDAGIKYDYEFRSSDKVLFPRMGDRHKDNGDKGYRYWSGMGKVQEQIDYLEQQIARNPNDADKKKQLDALKAKKPSFGNNIRFFVNYQLGYMWFRYFMWNFSGRQSEEQGHSFNEKVNGNWISGIPIIDNIRLGSQSKLPDELKNNEGRNKYYMLPFLLGILGMVFHYKRRKNDFLVTLSLFLFTGILIIVFLNQPPFEPRERDYTNVGSFQTFCIWIGLGVLGLVNFLKKYISIKGAAVGALVVSLLAAPVLMASENWDDHDRSDRYLGIDFAVNYLESCAPNAILFTNGDNDTYPLWYAQNVEGIRSDVRVINMALLPTDWYSSALLRKVYDSEPLPLTVKEEDLVSGTNDFIQHSDANGRISQTAYFDLGEVIKWVLTDDNSKKAPIASGEYINYLPVRKFKVAVDKEAVKKNNVVMEKDYGRILNEVLIDYPKTHMNKGDLVLFDLIAENARRGWERPIYFTSTTGTSSFINLQSYFQQEGLVYRFVPIKFQLQGSYPQQLADDILYTNIMTKYKWSGMKERETFFLDDKATLVPQNIRYLMYRLSNGYYMEAMNIENQNTGMKLNPDQASIFADKIAENEKLITEKRDKAKKLIEKSLLEMPVDKIRIKSETAVGYIDICRKLGMEKEGDQLEAMIVERAEQNIAWLKSMSKKHRSTYAKQLAQQSLNALSSVEQIARQNNTKNAASYKTKLDELTKTLNPLLY